MTLEIDDNERPRCYMCQQPIESGESLKTLKMLNASVHEDCYLRAVGNEIEQNPIGSPIKMIRAMNPKAYMPTGAELAKEFLEKEKKP